MTESEILQGAKATLAQVCLDMGVRPTDEALFWLLGLVYGESRFGQSPDWTLPNADNTEATNPGAPAGPSHNWGAVRVFGSQPFIIHGDRKADGTPEKAKFARFATQADGARNFLRTLTTHKAPVTPILSGQGTARDLAAAMFANGYFTGTTGTPDDRINAYANMILSGAARVRKVLGAAPSSPSGSPNSPAPSGSGEDPEPAPVLSSHFLALFLLAGAAGGALYFHKRGSLPLPDLSHLWAKLNRTYA